MQRTIAFVSAMISLCVMIANSVERAKPFASKIGVHLIGEYTAGTRKMVRARMPVLKILDPWKPMIDAARDYKQANPDGKVVLRCYEPVRYTLADDPEQKAQEHWDKIVWKRLSQLPESDRRLIDYIEATNECGECPTWEDEESIRWFTRFSVKWAEICAKNGYRPCIACIPVGNPGGSPEEIRAKIRQYAPALRAAKKAGGVWSYHAYTIEYTTDPAIERWYSLRYRMFYEAFTGEYADLKDMPMILTEGGVDRAGNRETDGWQARGTAEQYQKWLRWFDSEIKKDRYVIGITLFQQGDTTWWKSFDLEPMADWFVEYWNKGAKENS